MELKIAWRMRKDLSIACRSIKALPRHFGNDIKDFSKYILTKLFKEILRGSSFYRKAKSIAIDLNIVDRELEIEDAMVSDTRTKSSDLDAASQKPTIFISACISSDVPGGWKHNGGIKEYNCLVKLLRQKGYDAYIVTYDGNYEPWLVEHQPCISLSTFLDEVKSNKNIRCISSWAVAKAFIQECENLYFWDMELCVTENEHFPLIASLYRKKIKKTAGISCTIQAWHMAHFNKQCVLLPNLIDDALWFPVDAERRPNRVGYMDEGLHTSGYLEIIRESTISQGLQLEFLKIQGDEKEIVLAMRSCEVFLTMNQGKDPLWGEGGPLPPLEAMATGCVPIAFDLLGPRQIIQSGFSGVIVPRYRPDLMAQALVDIYRIPDELERLRRNTIALFQSCHTMESRWPFVVDFLDL